MQLKDHMFFLAYLITVFIAHAQNISPTLTRVEEGVEIIIPISLQDLDNKKVPQDSIELKTHNPEVTVGALSFVPAPNIEDKQAFLEEDFAIIALLSCPKKISELTIDLSYNIQNIEDTQKHTFTVDWPEECHQNIFKRLTNFISSLLTETQSYSIQLFLALLLGLLMSLTPCLYPMIPITMGILQSQGSNKSLLKNLTLALSYTSGIASTFALLGLTAAFTGQLFGKIMQNPYVITILVLWLLYMAFGMLGAYELFLPKVTQQSDLKKKGSLLTAFLFGALSGTIASPCLSPGLALLLTIVAALGDLIKGFFLLFSFGLGLGIPLTIIGTFSGSISMLPRAGMWMVEVKRVFGFLLLALAFYFAKNILTIKLWIILVTLCCIAVAIFFISTLRKRDSKVLKLYKIAVIFAFLSVPFFAVQNYRQSLNQKTIDWQTNLEQAQEAAKQSNKNILIDFTTDYCSLCKQIEKNLFEQKVVAKYLETNFVPTYINLSNPEHETLQTKFKIKGVPTIIIVDHELKELKRFGSELTDFTATRFIALLKQYEKK